MRNITKYALFCGCILALSACSEKTIPDPWDGTTTEEIGFRFEGAATKGFIESQTAFDVPATKIRVFDFLTGTDGTGNGTAEVKYIDDEIHGTIAADGSWAYRNEDTHYFWTKKGIHRFFGYLTQAPDGTAFATAPAFDDDTKTLSVPSLTMDTATPQFDFVYSDIIERDAADATQHGIVKPTFKHLFSAIALKLTNESDDIITVQSVSLAGFKNTKSATVDYSVAYSETDPLEAAYSAVDGSPLALVGPAGEFSPETSIDLLTGNTAVADPNFILMWPQTADELRGTSFEIKYTVADDYQEDGTTLTVYEKSILFTETDIFNEIIDGESVLSGMKAGKKYSLEFIFKGKTIDLRLIVLPWDYNEYDFDYSESAIDSGPGGIGEMDFDQHYAGYNRERRTVTLRSQSDVIQGIFQIYAPHTGEWALSVYGTGVDYFTVSPMGGVIDFDLTAGRQNVEFTVTPSTTAPPTTVELHFNVSIRLNGEWVDANSEFNRKDWKIVWER